MNFFSACCRLGRRAVNGGGDREKIACGGFGLHDKHAQAVDRRDAARSRTKHEFGDGRVINEVENEGELWEEPQVADGRHAADREHADGRGVDENLCIGMAVKRFAAFGSANVHHDGKGAEIL